MSDCFPFNNIQVSHCILMHSYVFEMSTFIHIHNTHASIVRVHAGHQSAEGSQQSSQQSSQQGIISV